MPDTWGEAKEFKDSQRENPSSKQRILRKRITGSQKYNTYFRISGDHKTKKSGYDLHWIYTADKKNNDYKTRMTFLKKSEAEMSVVMDKLNKRKLKTRDEIDKAVKNILKKNKVERFYDIEINEKVESKRKQVGRGRPNEKTEYKDVETVRYSLCWHRNNLVLEQEKNVDGLFPILCTDDKMGAKEALVAYKFQPNLEKRFRQLKSIHKIAPTLCKKVERVEALMFLFFLALILQAVIEREVRQNMKEIGLEALAIYPEDRLSYHPTTAKIFDQFKDVSVSYVMVDGKVVKEYRDELTDLQVGILSLLNISEEDYWRSTEWTRPS